MDNLILRRPLLEDVPQVTALMNAYATALIGRAATTESLLQYEWQLTDLSVHAWVVEDAGRIVGYLILGENGWEHDDAPAKTYRIWGYFDPQYPKHVVGKLLLDAVERQALEQGVRVEIDYRANTADAEIVALLRDCGFAPARTFWQMRRSLDGLPETPPVPEGITIRPAIDEQDRHGIYELHMQSFRDHWNFNPYPYQRWLRLFTSYPPAYDPSFWMIAEAQAGTEKVGFVIGTPGQITVPEMGYAPKTGYIHLMGTRADWRGRGVATALLYTVFQVFRERGLEQVSLGVDATNPTGAVHLYQKVGMARTMVFEVYRKIIQPN